MATTLKKIRKASSPVAGSAAVIAELARRNGSAGLASKPRDLGMTLGRGLLAGAAGTAAMTVSSTIEAKIRHRGESKAPAEAVEQVTGVEPESEEAESRLAGATHWAYGTSWGVARGALDLAGLDGPRATAAHGAIVWGAALIMLPALRVAPPPWKWGAKELAIDAFHHAVYAGATGAAYEALER